MKGALIILGIISCALARPDIGLKLREQEGYHLQPPATSYGVPSGGYLPPTPDKSGGDYGSSSFGSNVYDQFGGFVSQDFSSHSSSTSGSSTNGGFSGFQGSSLSSSSSSSSTQALSAGADVQKHVYFFDAPDDEPAPQLRISYQQSSPKKNYRVVFIKAPSYKAPKIPEIPVQNQDQEKTVVYVLVKKQDEGQEIVIPTSAPSKPSKPDVYFVKYKTKQEAEQKIQSIQQGATSGVSANAVGSDTDFVSTIRDSQSGGGNSADFNSQIIHTSTFPSQGQQQGGINFQQGQQESGGRFGINEGNTIGLNNGQNQQGTHSQGGINFQQGQQDIVGRFGHNAGNTINLNNGQSPHGSHTQGGINYPQQQGHQGGINYSQQHGHQGTHVQGGINYPQPQGQQGTLIQGGIKYPQGHQGTVGNYGHHGGNTINLSNGQGITASGTHNSPSTTSGYNFGHLQSSGPYKKREIKL